MYQAKFGVISMGGGGGGGVCGIQKIKVAQNSLKQVLVLEFLRFDDIFEILCVS